MCISHSYSTKQVHNLKEIEKKGAKKGVIPQAIKDVNQSLVDDNLVETDKIGIGVYFWALPSKGFTQRENLIKNIDNQLVDVKKKRVDIEQRKKVEVEKRAAELPADIAESTGFEDRKSLIARVAELKKKNAELKASLSQYERCAPERIAE